MDRTTLYVDLGNTRLKAVRFHTTGRALKVWRIAWGKDPKSMIQKVCQEWSDLSIQTLYATSVNPAMEQLMRKALSKFHLTFTLVERSLPAPLRSHYDLTRIGLDRLCNIAAAATRFPKSNLLVMDSGTALTVELIIAGVHQGGWILPGEKTLLATLHHHTALLSALTSLDFGDSPGKNSTQAIARGCTHLFQYGLQGWVAHLKRTYPHLTLVITGGNRHTLKRFFPEAQTDPLLTLRGITHLAASIKKPRLL